MINPTAVASRYPASLLCAAALLAAAAPPAPAADPPLTWNQWRGPTRDGFVAAGSPAWPDSLGKLAPVWRIELGESYSGPIIAADRVFVTETIDKQRECVRALDRASGRELWKAQWPGSMSVPFFAKKNGDWIRSTPAYDGESLFVAGMRDVLVCLDAADGRERWRVDFTQRYQTPLPEFGFVCSPLVDAGAVYVQAGAAVCKLDKRTGETVWRSLVDGGGMFGSAFSSPLLADLGGRRQLLVQTREKLCGLCPEKGDVLWEQEVPNFRGMNILTPTVWRDAVFTSSYRNKSFLYALSPATDAGRFDVSERWTAKPQGYMSSPVLIGDHAYLHLQNRRFVCLELATGKECWRSNSFGEYWSLVASGDRLLALDERGELLLIRATPEKFELLDKKKISDQETWAHLAVAGDLIVVRELKAVAAYRWQP